MLTRWPPSSQVTRCGVQTALVDGIVGVAWAPGGTAKVVWDITITGDTITRIDMVADPDSLQELDLVILD